jgi:hypothetical protein
MIQAASLSTPSVAGQAAARTQLTASPLASAGAPNQAAGAQEPATTASPEASATASRAAGRRTKSAVPDLPYRQDDPHWGNDLMWDRAKVIKADTMLNGDTKKQAESLMREFPDGNSIGNEGCELTSMAMILRLLSPKTDKPWTPRTLNQEAQARYYYTPCGLSMAQLNADLVSEVSKGSIGLAMKEEYLSGIKPWPKMFCNTSALVRAYRSLTPEERKDYAVMIKIGTYDDTVASHYLLLDPNDTGSPDGDDPLVLDPAEPLDQTGPWHLSDSSHHILGDPEIAKEWKKYGIEPTQLGGAWVYAKSSPDSSHSVMGPLAAAWARELARPATAQPAPQAPAPQG